MKTGLFLLLILGMSSFAFAETYCQTFGCNIEVVLKIAVAGADDSYINLMESEIENVWNGPQGYRTVGDCECSMTFEVMTMKITNASQVNCNPGPPGYHCIMVTDYNSNPPRNQSAIAGAEYHRGYMYGIASGNGSNSQKGWWSNIMNTPSDPNDPTSEVSKDFAHEAGHMMGLEDGDGGIMSRPWGANSGPTQENLEEILEDICGEESCPDICCCGNNKKDAGKEECEPITTNDDCPDGESCCPVCCKCLAPMCDVSSGEYMFKEVCDTACYGGTCYKNYNTGCWDCKKQVIQVHNTCYDSFNVRGNTSCHTHNRPFINNGVNFYENDLSILPVLGDLFANERINIKTEEGDVGHIITQEKDVTSYGEVLLEDHTVTVSTDRETISLIAAKELDIQQALGLGMIQIEGNGLVDGVRFGFYHLAFDVFNFFNPAEEFVEPEEGTVYPKDYFLAMEEAFGGKKAPSDPNPGELGDLPDGGIFGSDVYPYSE